MFCRSGCSEVPNASGPCREAYLWITDGHTWDLSAWVLSAAKFYGSYIRSRIFLSRGGLQVHPSELSHLHVRVFTSFSQMPQATADPCSSKKSLISGKYSSSRIFPCMVIRLMAIHGTSPHGSSPDAQIQLEHAQHSSAAELVARI